MSKGYWIVRVDVDDPDAYRSYAEQAPTVVRGFGGRFLVRGGMQEIVEGTGRARNTVIEFPSYAAALECFHSSAYQAIRSFRLAAATFDLVISEGFEAPAS